MQKKSSRQSEKPSKGKRRRMAVLGLAAVLLVAIGTWQRENLKALYQFFRYSQEELEQQLEENETNAQELLQEVPKPQEPSPPLEPEIETDAADAEPSKVPQKKSQPIQSKPPAKKEKPAGQVPPESVKPNNEEEIAELVQRAYDLRVKYTAILDEMHYDAMREYYRQLGQGSPKSDYLEFLNGFASQVIQMEKDCDKEIDGIVQELRRLLKESGQSTKLADEVAYTYAHEKSTRKALYMSELKEKGLV